MLSNVDKVYWPEEGYTKGDLLNYYASIASYILPYLKNRPLVLRRFPEGIKGPEFFQKDIHDLHPPKTVKIVKVAHTNKSINYIVVQNVTSLLYVANLGSIELNPFNSTLKHLDSPDYMVLDIDPENVPFSAVIDVALAAHELLQKPKIPHFCKTSGSRGLHIYVPLAGKYDYDITRDFAFLLGNILQKQMPELISLKRNPQKRQKRVYIDFLQNRTRQTMVSVYSVRAKPHATVSAPLSWKEVKYGLDPTDFTMKTMPKRLALKGDLFEGVLGKGINLKKCLENLEGFL